MVVISFSAVRSFIHPFIQVHGREEGSMSDTCVVCPKLICAERFRTGGEDRPVQLVDLDQCRDERIEVFNRVLKRLHDLDPGRVQIKFVEENSQPLITYQRVISVD